MQQKPQYEGNYVPPHGSVSAWKNENRSNDRQPHVQIVATAHRDLKAGDEVELALWPNTKRTSHKSPHFTGNMKDPYRKEEKDFDDEITF